ncbi:sugar porter family MFS transporter [Bifidobacterium sp. ESL0682]|uniref:sugar porter family MFS transporter n=1 Tax=Bifidobacterium sp. ESL0682 TaxID=2983212 RepID=UPI0023F8E90C|nr:sugar porter family MFS transporter [Bifidobacterium sp. ESL0682]WEV41692.1 sugar porter family MFS transporter [Bifidobacterium sp. ESL0682]
MSQNTGNAPSSDEAVEVLDPKIRRRIILVCLAGAMGGLLFGYDTSVINGAVDAIAGKVSGFNLNSLMSGISVSGALLGCVIGAWFAGKLADRYGRVKIMLVAAVLFLVSAIGSGFAPGVWVFVIFRIVGGLGVGFASVVGPAYISEVAPTKMRGFLTSFQQFGVAIGMFLSTIVNNLLAKGSGSADSPFWLGISTWRWMLLMMVVPAVLMLIACFRLPESPRYLVMKGRDEEAMTLLRRLNGSTNPKAKVAQIRASLGNDTTPRLSDLRGHTFGLKKVVWIAIAIALFQQFNGVNIILYYDSSLWRSVGFSEQQALNISVIRSIVAFIPTILAMVLVDRVGRRKMLSFGSAGMTIFLVIATFGFYHATVTPNGVSLSGVWAPLTLVAVYLFYLIFCGTWGPAMWVVISEIFPNNIRAMGVAVATAFNWIGNFVVSTSFPSMRDGMGVGNVYLLYAVFAALSWIFVVKALPETNGVELEDMKAE